MYTERRTWNDPLLRTIIGTAVAFAIGFALVYVYWGNGPYIGSSPIFIPLISGIVAVASLSVAFLALGRYPVQDEPAAFWLGLGLSAMGILFVIHALAWPEIGPTVWGISSTQINTPLWLLLLSRMITGVCLLVAALSSWPRASSGWTRRWPWLVAGWFVLVVLVGILCVTFEASLPHFVTMDGAFTVNLNIVSMLLIALHGGGAVVATRRYRSESDHLFGYVALLQITIVFAMIAGLLDHRFYGFWWYLNRVSAVGGLFVLLFGVLSGYVNLYRRERGRMIELERQQALLQAVLKQMPSGLIVAEAPSGRITLSNDRAVEILGHNAIPSVGPMEYTLYGAVHHNGTPYRAEEHPLTKALAGEIIIQQEVMYRQSDGHIVWLSANAAPVRDEQGEIRAAVVSFQNITGQREAEKALLEVNETLEQRVIERTEQLRALTVELSGAEERERRRLARLLHDHLQQLLVAARFQIDSLRRAAHNAQRVPLEEAGRLLDESIRVSRNLTAELSPPVLYDMGLPAALDWLGRWMEEHHGLLVHCRIEDGTDIPDQSLRAFIYHAARELLFNVVKHARVNEAMLELERDDNSVHLTIQDEGVGFDPSQQATIPGSFGLFSIRERLEYLGGYMQVQSAAGKGTRVMLHVPLGLVSPVIDAVPDAVQTIDGREDIETQVQEYLTHLPDIRVVVADDHHIIRQGLVVMLQDEDGFDVVGQAADGRQALDLALRLRPDIVLMDVTMPDMDGIEATERIRDQVPEVQVVGLSMHVDSQVATRMYDAGAAAYLTKTGDLDELLDTLRRVASMRQN
ncbi:MAG: response regulator [Anaerolineae bacterium]|jgi:PAS domain S-box-containing protein